MNNLSSPCYAFRRSAYYANIMSIIADGSIGAYEVRQSLSATNKALGKRAPSTKSVRLHLNAMVIKGMLVRTPGRTKNSLILYRKRRADEARQ